VFVIGLYFSKYKIALVKLRQVYIHYYSNVWWQ